MKLSYKQKYQLLRNILLYIIMSTIAVQILIDFFVKKGIIIFR